MSRRGREGMKQALIAAAISVISREGFHNATTDLIAAEAGVSVGTIYRYFSGKDHILATLFEDELRKRTEVLNQVKSLEGGLYRKLKAFLEFHFSEVVANPDLARIVVRERRFPRRRGIEAVERYQQVISGLLQEILQEEAKAARLRPCDCRLMAVCLLGAVEAATADLAAEQEAGSAAVTAAEATKRRADEIATLFARGLS